MYMTRAEQIINSLDSAIRVSDLVKILEDRLGRAEAHWAELRDIFAHLDKAVSDRNVEATYEWRDRLRDLLSDGPS